MGTYAAFGYGGHAIYVVPDFNLVFVHRADTYKERRGHVSNTAIRNILTEVIKARTGPAESAPKLITADIPETDVPGPTISKAQTSGLTENIQRVDLMLP